MKKISTHEIVTFLITCTSALFPVLPLSGTTISIRNDSSLQKNQRSRTIERVYHNKLRKIDHDIETLKAALLLYDPAVHTPRLDALESAFNALTKELADKELDGAMSDTFTQERANVERKLRDTRQLMKTPDQAPTSEFDR